MELTEIFEKLVSLLIPFVGFIFGLVEFLKAALELEGKAVTWMSFGVGSLCGALAYIAYLFPSWGVYVAGAFFVLSTGLVASGYYKFVDKRLASG